MSRGIMSRGLELGTGIGWRPEIAEAVERMRGVDWVEVVAENVCPEHVDPSLARLRERGVTVVPHGVALGLGGAERPDAGRLAALAERVEALGAPLVSEHIAFVRAGGALTASPRLEAGHLLPVPRTRDALDVLCENVRVAQDALPVPLALENIAALISWPGEELTEGQFLTELVERTGVRLLIDVANLYTNQVNRGEDASTALDELPLEAIGYVHVAGGVLRDGVWHDSHAHPVPGAVLDILADLASRVSPPGVLLERDADFPDQPELERELTTIRAHTTNAAPGDRRAPVAAPRERALVTAGRPSGAPLPVGKAPARHPVPEPSTDTSTSRGTSAGAGAGAGAREVAVSRVSDAVRQRVALRQASLLSALVAGTPAPEGFDRARLRVQSRALTGKRADVVAKVAPELPRILGAEYRPAFLAYARNRPLTAGARRDALDFAAHLLRARRPRSPGARRELTRWWLDRSGPAPLTGRPVARLARAARHALLRR
ncbi:MbnB/TglH/ChrH family RiPP precursor modification enzyme [Streptomyces sp. O3]